MEVFIILLGLVWSVLSIILFFKIWSMTDDVRHIKEILDTHKKEKHNNEEATNKNKTIEKQNGFSVDQLVVYKKTEAQLKIVEITSNGTFICKKAGTDIIMGEYKSEELEDFDEYWSKKNG